ncbi:MAG: hemerythrin domain-containing protein [Myxococcota bacterium]
MPGTITEFMREDHARLDRLLDRAVADPHAFDHAAFETFRGGILRHIGMEEKILVPELRCRLRGEVVPHARRLRVEHAAISSLLVPTPSSDIVREVRVILAEHNALEEGPGGLYELCEKLLGDEAPGVVEKLAAARPVPLAPHHDGPTVKRTAEEALASAERIQAYRDRAHPAA